MGDLQYTYGGQWFDDMGALALSFMDQPALGVDIANTPIPRNQQNELAKNMLGSNMEAYDQPPPVVGVQET
jgi:hypothetical protein